jgi:asparagine synthase (glutamine-hydrolysing)
MCGVCGILDYGTTNPSFDERLLRRMSDTIRHRGPDDEGIFISPNRRLGFGFRRLSIVDLSPAGHQPMSTPDGSITIVFNGEIYNHLVLRRELEAKGYRYRSRSDTETILYAYQEYGTGFVHKLLGMFGIALWDDRRQRLVLARDRIGIKPLYYSFANGSFIFGSEIKSILQHPSAVREMDISALEHYLTFLIPPAPITMFRNIFKLEAGHTMIVEANGEVLNEEYWNPVAISQPSIRIDGEPSARSELLDKEFVRSEETCIDTIHRLLKQSIKDRMMSDVPFGVFLSGGIDSSTNVALMAELMNRPVDTFSVGFRDLEKYNELGYARQIAKQFKTNHHEIIIDQKDAFDFLPKLIFHQDEPLADPVCIPLYFVSKLARDNGTIVVQVGEGSDEQFAGYQWMKRELAFYRTIWKWFGVFPDVARKATLNLAGALLKPRQSYLALDYIRKSAEGDELFWGGAINFTETHKRALLARRAAAPLPQHRARRWHEEILRADPEADYLKRMIYLEFRHRLPELLLMRVDKVAMATSVEARVPFLDHRMVEYSMHIPQSYKLKNGETKYILKKAVEGIIPRNIIYRRKQGFAAPMNEWLRNEWSGFVAHAIQTSKLTNSGIFRREETDRLIKRHQSGEVQAGQLLWNLLNLVLWHRYWIEGEPIE